jgi:hypothetical protein
MAAQLKEPGQTSSIQLVRARDFLKVVQGCENPPRASAALKDFVAKGRAAKKKA